VELWWANTPISEYKGWRGRICNYIYPILPKWVIHFFQDLVLLKVYSPLYKGPSYTYIKARNYHLYERFDEAIENYNEVIEKTSDKKTLVASTFWKGMIYFRKKEFHKASKIFEDIIKNHPKSGLVIAAERWLLRVAMTENASSSVCHIMSYISKT
jgi:TolA-binding protein